MLADVLEKRVITDGALWAAWARGDDIFEGESNAGAAVTEGSALQLMSVYSSVRLIADAVATLPIRQYRKPARIGALPEEIPLVSWLVQPNVDTDSIAFQSQLMTSLLLRGNAYIVPFRAPVAGIPNPLGPVTELWALHPDYVSVRRNSPQLLSPRQYYVLGQIIPPGTQLLHVPGLFQANALTGLDPITFAKECMGLGLAGQDAAARFFRHGAVPTGIIKSQGTVTDPQAEEIRNRWERMHGGLKNMMRTAVLGGGAEFQQISVSPDQAQFLQSRQYSDEQIERLFGMGDPFGSAHASMTYANVEQRGIDVSRYTLMPWIYRLEQAFSSLLPRGQYVQWDMESLTRPDTESLYHYLAIALRNRMMTPNEARLRVGLPPLPPGAGGDELLPWPPPPGVPSLQMRTEDDAEIEAIVERVLERRNT